MKNSIKILILGSFALLLNSCYYDEMIPVYVAPIPDGTTVTYKADIAPMLAACTACHNGTQTPDLRNTQAAYNNLFPNYVRIGNASGSKLYYFPPGSPTSGHPSVGVTLSAANFATIKYWIETQALYE